ncbi:uncharacterized protein LOC143842022 [Paroedura picta]|uniref:uncharacterized protein LOC143842022 n=1 Tax=Paroedura picta TaxID=143630 RepID=UPI004056DAC7
MWPRVALCSSFSSTTELSISVGSRTKGSSSSAQSQRLFHAVILQEKVCKFCCQVKSDASSGRGWPKGVFPERTRRAPSPHPAAAPDRHHGQRARGEGPPFLGTKRSQTDGFGAGDTPFPAEAARANLERHLLAKRIQHELGLPRALLRSLRAFLPPAPAPPAGRPLRSLAAAPRPPAVPSLGAEAKRELEHHLRKMVRLKRWGLPRRVQEALRHMRPDSCPPGDSAFPEDQQPVPRPLQRGPLQKDMTFPPAPVFQPELPAPPKAAGGEEREWPVAEPSPQGRCDRQPSRRRTCQRKADKVALKTKSRSVRAVPPGQVPSKAPTLPPCLPPAPEGGPPQPTAPADLDRLELHILWKRLQHHWGLPGLIQRSLHHFLPEAPPLPAPHPAPSRGKVKVSQGAGRLPFLPGETQRHLDEHLRSQVLARRWGLPQRALQSLRAFMPESAPHTQRPKEREKGRASPRAKRSPSARVARPPKSHVDALEEDLSWRQKCRAVQKHLAKKALEVQLGLLCPLVQSSQEAVGRGRKRALPRMVPRGPRVAQPRCQEVPFVDPAGLDRIRLNLTHKNLAYKWGLPTLYRTSLARLCDGPVPPAPPSLPPPRAAGADFSPRETQFVGKQTREELEWHVKRRQLQHRWGLPGLVQRSLRSFLPTPLPLTPARPGPERVRVSRQRLSFLSKETEQKLDLNVRKRVLLQQWGLPRVVLRSLRALGPETELRPPGREASGPPLAPPSGPSQGLRTFPGALDGHSQARPRAAATPHRASRGPRAGPQDPETMAHHVARKSVEVQLGVLPPVARQSWRLFSLARRQPLPRWIPRGQGALCPRRGFLPFVPRGDVDRIQVAISRHRLASLWGLGLHYVGALAGVGPKPPRAPLMPRHPSVAFRERPTPFFPRQGREALELNIQRKRLQHEWGLPALVQKSLKALVEGLPSLPAPAWPETHVNVLPEELPFLPQSTLRHLELHVQKMKLHRQWGLPRRALQYLRALRPQAGSHVRGERGAQAHYSRDTCPFCSAQGDWGAGPSTQRAGRAARRGLSPFTLGPRMLGILKHHTARKCMEVRLGAFPALARESWRRGALQQPLPKLLPPGRTPLQPRSPFLPFARREDVDRIELAVRHSHLRALFGLGTRFVEAAAALAPRLSPQPRAPRVRAVVFSEAKTPFLAEQDREALERLVRRKRLQHLWGLPGLVRRALAAFMPTAPSAPTCPKAGILVQTHEQELPFLSPEHRRALELHLQKLKIQRQWGLPGRVLKSLKMLLPSGSTVGSSSTPPISLPPPSAEHSTHPGSGPHKEEKQLSLLAPPKRSLPRPAFPTHPVTRGKKNVPRVGGLLGAAQLRRKGREEPALPLPFFFKHGAGRSDPKKSANKKLSLIGSILEKKLHLEHGLHTWLLDQEKQRGLWRDQDGKGGYRGAGRSVLLLRGAGPAGTVRREEGQGGRRLGAGSAREKALSPAHPPRSQAFQAGRMKPLVRREGDSGKPRGKSQALGLDRIGSREMGRGRGLTPMAKGGKQGYIHRGRREQRLSNKEWRLGGTEQSSALKGWPSTPKEQRPRSGERIPSSKEQRPDMAVRRPGTEEQQAASVEQRSRSKERRLSSTERMPGSKERTLSSEEQRPGGKGGIPASEDQRPSSKERTLGNKEQTPSSKERRPSSQERRPSSKEQWPSSQERRPSIKGQRPSSKERRPSSKERRPSSKEQRPSSKERRPSSKERRPSSQERRPSSTEQWPSSKGQRPSSQERTLGNKEQTPSSKERRPSSQERRPSSKEQWPSSKGQRPSSQERRPSIKGQRPSSKERRPSSKEQRPSSKERRPSSKEQRPSSKERRPSSKEQRPSSKERRPSSKEQRPSSKERRPSSKEQRPSSKERRPSSKERRPSSKERRPSSKEQRPSSKERRPSSKERRPSSKERRPSSKEQRPSSKERRPSSKERKPSSKERRPSSKERKPSSKERRPSSKERRPSSNERRPSSKERTAGNKGQTLSMKEKTLGSKEQRPSSQERVPSSQEQRLSSREGRPGGPEQRLSSREGRPGSQEQRLSSREGRLGSQEQRPGSEEQRSRSKERSSSRKHR